MKNSGSFKWLMKKSKCQRANMVWLILSNIIFSVLTIVFAFCVRGIIDGGVEQNVNKIVAYSIGICSVVLLQFVFRLIINGLTEHIKGKLEMEYKSFVFKEILNKKYEDITKFHSGELINRLTSDSMVASDGMANIIPTVVSSVVRLICAVVALVLVDWVFALAFLLAGILVAVIINLNRQKLKSLHKRVQETDGITRSYMQECIENDLVVKVFSDNDKLNDKATDLQKTNFSVKMKRKNYSVTGHALYNVVYSCGYLFALIYGAFRILYSLMTFGDLSLILQLVNNVQVPFASLSNLVPKYYAMIASAERLMEIENLENEDATYLDKDEIYNNLNKIVFDNISFDFDNETVFDSATGEIKKGEFVAITGLSGQGKSTLMYLLTAIYKVNNGEIYLENLDKSKINISVNTRKLFSYVPQSNMLFSGTIRENIAFTNIYATDSEIDRAVKLSDSEEFIKELPLGLNTVVGEKGLGLSIGQVQRIAIARAILNNSPVLIFDEATSALDEMAERKVLTNLKQMKDKTIIVISHKKAVLDLCDREIKIENRKIIEN